MNAERIPPRTLADFALRARNGLPVALALFCTIAGWLVTASVLLPTEYTSSAAVLLTPNNAEPSHSPPDAITRSAAVDKSVEILNSPALAAEVLAILQTKAPQDVAASPARTWGIWQTQFVRAHRRGESYVVDVAATSTKPLVAKMTVETAIDLFPGRRPDGPAELVATNPPTRAGVPVSGVMDPNSILLRLEAEMANLQKAASQTEPAAPGFDKAPGAASELAQALSDAAAMKVLLRSEVTAIDISNFRASGAIDRLGEGGPAFVADLARYEAVLEEEKQDPAKANGVKYNKYKILTAAAQLQPSLDARVASLAAAPAALTPPQPSTQSSDTNARIAELERQIEEQRKLVEAAKHAEPAQQPATIATPTRAGSVDVRILSRPEPGVAASWRQPLILYPAVFGVGVMVAIAYLALLMFASNTVVDPRDAAALAGAPLLAVVPRLTPAQLRELPPGERHPANYAIEHPASAFADATRAAFSALRQPRTEVATCIAVAGGQVGDGASTFSLAFARTAAVAGLRVLLIDTDFTTAGLTRAMGIEPAAGIEAILGGHRQLADLVVEDQLTSAHLLPSAPSEASQGALSLTQLTALKTMLAGARGSYDMIVIDCQPHDTRARTRSMARLADTVLIVGAYDMTKRYALRAFSRRMQHIGVVVCGVVFNFIPARSRPEHVSFVAEPAEIGQAYLIPPSELRLPVVRENPVIH